MYLMKYDLKIRASGHEGLAETTHTLLHQATKNTHKMRQITVFRHWVTDGDCVPCQEDGEAGSGLSSAKPPGSHWEPFPCAEQEHSPENGFLPVLRRQP